MEGIPANEFYRCIAKTKDNKLTPYDKYKNTKNWQTLEKAINSLMKNKDIKIITSQDYVVGYICQVLSLTKNKKGIKQVINTKKDADDEISNS